MPRKTSSPTKWQDGTYVQIYVTAGSRDALRIGAAVHHHSIPQEVERLLLADSLHTGNTILVAHGEAPVQQETP
jgi:hypothetical protein